jgi:hypothetical protein
MSGTPADNNNDTPGTRGAQTPQPEQPSAADLQRERDDRSAHAREWVQGCGKEADEELWEWFRMEFEGWKRREFELLTNDVRKVLKAHLRRNGVYVHPAHNGEGLPEQFARVIAEIEPAVWTDTDARREETAARNRNEVWNSRFRSEIQEEWTRDRERASTEGISLGRQSQNPSRTVRQPDAQTPLLADEQPVRSSIEHPARQTAGAEHPAAQQAPEQPRRMPRLAPVDYYEGDPYNFHGVSSSPRGPPRANRHPTAMPGASYGRDYSIPRDPWQYPAAPGPFPEYDPRAEPRGYQYPPLQPYREQRRPEPGPRGPPRAPPTAPPGAERLGRDINSLIMHMMRVYPDKMKYHGSADDLDIKIRIFYDFCWKAGLSWEHYHLAFSNMLSDEAAEYYHDNINGQGRSFIEMVQQMRSTFESAERTNASQEEWDETTLLSIKKDPDNASKSWIDCFDIMFRKLQKLQRALELEQQTEQVLKRKVLRACAGVEACNLARFKPSETLEKVRQDLRHSLSISSHNQSAAFVTEAQQQPEAYLVGRRFQTPVQDGNHPGVEGKKCVVCKKPGCWSSNHPKEDVDKAWKAAKKTSDYKQHVRQFFLDAEGRKEPATAFDALIDLPSDSDDEDTPPASAPSDRFVTFCSEFGVADTRRVF